MVGGTEDHPGLTKRELEVLQEAAFGKSDEEIAKGLFLSVYTVKTHMRHILIKMQANNRTQAVNRGLREGLISY